MEYLTYVDYYIYKNKKYFSNVDFNGLFSVDLNDSNVEFLGYFPEDKLIARFIHKSIIGINHCIFFFPLYGKGITIYNILEKKFIFKNIGEKEQLFCVASTFIYNDKIIIIPANIQNNIYVLNYENYELKEVRCFKENHKVITVDLFGTVKYNEKIYIVNRGTNEIYSINLLNFDIEKHTIKEMSNIRNINIIDGYIWLTDCCGKKVARVDIKDFSVVIINYEYGNDNNKIPLIVEKWNNDIIVLPGSNNVVYKLDYKENKFVNSGIIISQDWVGDIVGYKINRKLVLYSQKNMGITSEMQDKAVIVNENNSVDRKGIFYKECKNMRIFAIKTEIKREIKKRGYVKEKSETKQMLEKFIKFIGD